MPANLLGRMMIYFITMESVKYLISFPLSCALRLLS